MHEKRFSGDIERLRNPERVERLEVPRVTSLCLENGRYRNVLDIGTGTGLFAQSFAKLGLDVSGVDVNPLMLKAARKFVPEGDFREGVMESLPFADNSFDLVFMGLVLHEADNVSTALYEGFRTTRMRLAILEWPFEEGEFGPPLADRLDPETLYTKIKQAGFRSWQNRKLTNTVIYILEKNSHLFPAG